MEAHDSGKHSTEVITRRNCEREKMSAVVTFSGFRTCFLGLRGCRWGLHREEDQVQSVLRHRDQDGVRNSF